MFTSNVQISPPSLVLNCKVAKFCIKEWPKAVNLKRIPTHKECKCREFSLQTRLGGEICSSDVIMHKGHSDMKLKKDILFGYNLKGIEKIIRENAFEQQIKKRRLKWSPGLVLINWALVYTNYRLYRKGSFLHSSLSWLGRVHMRTYASHSDCWTMYCSNCKQARSLPVCNWLDIRRWNSSSPHCLCGVHTCGLLDRPRPYKGHLVLLRPW